MIPFMSNSQIQKPSRMVAARGRRERGMGSFSSVEGWWWWVQNNVTT